jgi:predicted phosphoribosyltransferase
MTAAADEVVCAATPEPFFAVGAWYQDFSPTSDEEVVELLSGAGLGSGPSPTT